MKIFSGSANKPLAEKIARALGVELSSLEIHVFPDGEKRVRILERVVEEDCVVVQPTNPPVDEHYMELFFIVDALKRSGAKSTTVVIPYLGYQRQDHIFREGEAVSLEVVLKTIEAAGVTRMIVVDLHSIKTEQVTKIPLIHLSALPLFAKEIRSLSSQPNENNSFLVSPDMGGIRRVKLVSEMLENMAYVAVEKERDLTTGSVTAHKIVTSFWGVQATLESDSGQVRMTQNEQVTELKGRRAIIVDDMISSGKTIETAANLLRKKGVEEIYVFATHPVFSDDAPSLLQEADVQKVFVTDTIDVPEEKQFPKLTVLSIATDIAVKLKKNDV